MDYIIFKPLKKVKNKYYGKCKDYSSIEYISNISNLKLDIFYYIQGSILEDTYIVNKCYEYKSYIGTITNIKPLKNRKNLIDFITEDGIKFKAEVNSIYTELNSLNILSGYFDEKKIFKSILAKKLTTLKVKLLENVDVFSNKRYIKSELISKDSSDTLSNKKDKVILKGNFPLLYKGDEISAYGYYNDSKYGQIFNTLSFNKETSSGIEMMKIYLKNIIGTTLSKKALETILDKYKMDTIETLEKNPQQIFNDLKKIKLENLLLAQQKIINAKFLQDFFYFCEKEGISSDIADYIYKEYGLLAIDILKKNPYIITKEKQHLFEEADIIAKNFGKDILNIERIKSGIIYYLYIQTNSGDVYTNKDKLYDEIGNFIYNNGVFEDIGISQNLISESLKELEYEEKIKQTDNRIYLFFNYIYEKKSADLIVAMLKDFKAPFCKRTDIKNAIDNFNKTNKLAHKQEEAIYNALLNNISILTGGPGTGKTLTVNAILKSIKYIKADAKVRLCAPTGRASKRMSEVSGYPSTTIHKLLNLGAYGSLDDEMIPALQDLDFLIVDEFSMVDIKLLYELLKNLDSCTRLIIVGDYNQLPSVSAGQVMKDLIESKAIPMIELTEIFRQAGSSKIVKLAHKIIKKTNIDISEDLLSMKDKENLLEANNDFYFIEATTQTDVLEKLHEVLEVFINSKKDFENVQILSAMNKGSIGSDLINSEIQSLYNPLKTEKDEYNLNLYQKIRKGDKIIQTSNDYELEVMNGSIGFVEKVHKLEDSISMAQKEDEIEISFLDDFDNKIYNEKSISNIKLAYSITIHKSQGSEFPIIIVPFHNCQELMLNKNLLYTAITRAKSKLILIGNIELFIESLKMESTNRNSYLGELIKNLI